MMRFKLFLPDLIMNFCKCGGIMVSAGSGKMKCRSCGQESGKSKETVKVSSQHKSKELIVLEKDESTLPTMEKDCKSCGNREAYFWLKQTRSADEPPTQFYRCTKCKYTWRVYR